jgi:hypothetical protein
LLEVDSSYKKLIGIENHTLLEERGNNQTGTEVNNVLLDIECFPPHTRESDKYEEMIEYFTIKDSIHLENKPMEPFKEGQLCTQCFRGRLQTPGTKRVLREMDTKGKSLSGNVIDVTSNMKELIFNQVMEQIFLIGIAAE